MLQFKMQLQCKACNLNAITNGYCKFCNESLMLCVNCGPKFGSVSISDKSIGCPVCDSKKCKKCKIARSRFNLNGKGECMVCSKPVAKKNLKNFLAKFHKKSF